MANSDHLCAVDISRHASGSGFGGQEQQFSLSSGSLTTLHFQLPLAAVNQKVESLSGERPLSCNRLPTSTTSAAEQIATTPGADSRTAST